MTALKEYERLEASGLWRAAPDEQRREVIVSVGDATLTISDFNDRALAHWSLAAVVRTNPDTLPAIYCPDGDPGETLELAEGEDQMIEAIERLHQAIERGRPRPGRLRLFSVIVTVVAVLGVLVFWLPGAMMRHTVSVVPQIKRQEIGENLLDRVERVAGQACVTPETIPVLARLARRTGARKIIILRAGVKNSAHLPGGIVLLNKGLIESHEDPAVAAGHIVAERLRAKSVDPLARLLTDAGPIASFRLLTTGEVTPETLNRYAERVLIAPEPVLEIDALLKMFAETQIPSTPYAYARDPSGETVLGLIEADPTAGADPVPVLRDRDWVLLQNICSG